MMLRTCFSRNVALLQCAARPILGRVSSSRSLASLSTDPWEILGVQRGAPHTAVKEAYHDLARKHHPDLATTPDKELFARVSEAYQALSDPISRAVLERDPAEEARALAAAAKALADAGQLSDSMDLLIASIPLRDSMLTSVCSYVLAACAHKGGGMPHAHKRAHQLWEALLSADAVDAMSCNAYFAIALRGGDLKAAMTAYRHAKATGIEQSVAMRSYVMQATKYAQSLSHRK